MKHGEHGSPGDRDDHVPTHADSPFIAEDQSWWTGIEGTRIVWSIEDVTPWEAVIVAPANAALENYQLAGLRAKRHGGAHPADYALHQGLMQVLGGITLASGHVELEMKRILLTAKAEPAAGFADVDLGWKQLEEKLGEVSLANDLLASRLRPVLEWAEGKDIRERRNTAIHSAWCLYEIGHIEGARLPHKSHGQTRIDEHGELAATVGILWEYLGRLQKVVTWPMAIYPPLPLDTPQRTVHIEVATEDGS